MGNNFSIQNIIVPVDVPVDVCVCVCDARAHIIYT